MGLQATFSGQLTVGQASVSASSFPGGNTGIPITLNPDPKAIAVQTGDMVANPNSPSSYVTLAGIGAGGPVTQATTLLVITKIPMLLRLTVNNPAGGTTVIAGIPINGVLALEFDLARFLVLLEVQGAGIIEYFAAGTL